VIAIRQLVDPPVPGEASGGTLDLRYCRIDGNLDAVGALSTRLDPEDLRGIIGAYHERCVEVITKSGGFVATYMGDGVLSTVSGAGFRTRAVSHASTRGDDRGVALRVSVLVYRP